MPLKKPDVTDDTPAEQKDDNVPGQEVKSAQITTPPEVDVEEKSLANQQQSGMEKFMTEQADEGFEIEVNAFSFSRVKLDDGSFLLGTDDKDIGTSFKFKPVGSKFLYIVRQSSDNEAEMYYSYNPQGLTKIDGTSAKATLDAWKEDGYGTEKNPLDIKKYTEVMAELVDNGLEEDGQYVSLSIPPSSASRFGGVALQAKAKYGCSLSGVVIEASVGNKVGSGNKTFRPWNYKVVGRA